jgi:hypothetical protein
VDNTLYVSGQIGFLPETMEIVAGGVEPEARQALTNMGHILQVFNWRPGSTHKFGRHLSGIQPEAGQALTNMEQILHV